MPDDDVESVVVWSNTVPVLEGRLVSESDEASEVCGLGVILDMCFAEEERVRSGESDPGLFLSEGGILVGVS